MKSYFFKIISSSSANMRIGLMPAMQRKIFTELENISNDRYEQQLLKYFDFCLWAKNLINGKHNKISVVGKEKTFIDSQANNTLMNS